MSLIALFLLIALFGACVYLVTLIPMPAPFRTVIMVLAVILLIVFVLQALGVNTGLPTLRLR